MKQPTAINKDQLQRFKSFTDDMLALIQDDEDYVKWLLIIESLPETDINDFTRLGLMYLATERARRYVAQIN